MQPAPTTSQQRPPQGSKKARKSMFAVTSQSQPSTSEGDVAGANDSGESGGEELMDFEDLELGGGGAASDVDQFG